MEDKFKRNDVCHCNTDYCNNNNTKFFIDDLIKVVNSGESILNKIAALWDKFEIDSYMPDSELVEDYTCDLELDYNPNWILWEMEVSNV